MKYVENFAVLSPCEGGGFIYATTPAAFRFAARSTAASCVVGSSSFTFQFGAHEYIWDFSVADMQPVVALEKYVPIFPLIGESASFC